MPYTQNQIDTLEIINYVCETLSILGSVIIIVTYCIYEQLKKNFAYSLVLYLAIACMIRSVSKIFGSFLSADNANDFSCSLTAYFINLGGISAFLFTAAIAIVMYTIVKMKYAFLWNVSRETLQKRKRNIMIIIFTIGAIVSCFPFTQNAYTYVGAWCWITSDTQHWRWICYYGPLVTVFFFCVIVYGIILTDIRKLEEQMKDQKSNQSFSIFRKLKYYPLILLIAFFFPTIRRFYQIFDDEAPYWLGVCHTLGSGLFGLLNAMVYGINGMVTTQYKKSLEGSVRSHEMAVVESIDVASTAGKYDKSIGIDSD